MQKKKFLLIILMLTFYLNASPDQFQNILKSITGTEVYSYCKNIASPGFEGRLGGSPGFLGSAQWVREKFKKWGLKDITDNNYFQTHPSPYTVVETSKLILHLNSKEKPESLDLTIEKDYLPWFGSGNCKGKGKVVFAGWGIHAPELKYDDFYNIDIKGKYLLCFRGSPDRSVKEYRAYTNVKAISKIARKRGALGIIYISKKLYGSVTTHALKDIGVFYITRKIADLIFQARGTSAEELYNDLKNYKNPLSFETNSEFEGLIKSRHYPDGQGINIIGKIQGSDPKLQNETIVIGAHLDHLGSHSGLIYNGAHDNASGSAITLALAEAFSKIQTKRSLVFVLFDGEEKGLIGSRWMTNHLPDGLKAIKYMVNFELCGQGDQINCAVKSDFKELKTAFTKASEIIQIPSNFRERAGGMSDYAAFQKLDIPTVCITGGGPHQYYHQSRDNIYRINPDILQAITRFTFQAVFDLSNNR